MSTKREQMAAAANRLHHLSMRYAGAMQELVSGQPVGLIPSGAPGLSEARDFIDLLLFTRAEINGLTRLMIEAKIFSAGRFVEVMADEYDHFCKVKAESLGVEVNDAGLVFKKR